MPDRLVARLRAAFMAELEEQVRVMNADLLALERAPGDTERLKSLFRVAHTLKGAARAAGFPQVEQACHALESLLARAREGSLRLDERHFASLYSAADALADAHRRLAENVTLDGSPIAAVAAALGSGRSQPTLPAPLPTPVAPSERKRPAPVPERPAAAPPSRKTATQPAPAAARTAGALRVDPAKLDAVLAAAADLRQARSRIVTRVGELSPHLDGGLSAELRALGRAVDEVTQGVVGLRMRPFAEICESLPRMVRDLAAAESKDVEIEVQGGDVEADRGVLDALREPIVHLVRNAVSHGVERPDQRARAGKSRSGTITVSASLRGGRLHVTVADDGAGVDLDAVRRAMARAGKSAPADDAAVTRALFEAGVSTSPEASEISGRGVGLDVVRAAVERMGGSVSVDSARGRGAVFTLDCPLTFAALRVVLAQVGPHTVAVPSSAVERLLRIEAGMISRLEGRDVLPGSDGAGPIAFVSLARVLGPPYAERAVADATLAMRLHVGGARVAVAVDELIDECEVTIRPLRARDPLPLVNGAVLVSTGGAAPLLNAPALVTEALRIVAGGLPSLRAPRDEARPRRRILVVDDSITTRTLEQSVLEAAGYDVRTAADGAEAWRLLQEQPPDLVVSDVEMPRMTGFELCEAVRGSPRLARLPVILVTALETEEQRARGLAAGADAYLGKSSFDQQTLLDVIRQYLE